MKQTVQQVSDAKENVIFIKLEGKQSLVPQCPITSII